MNTSISRKRSPQKTLLKKGLSHHNLAIVLAGSLATLFCVHPAQAVVSTWTSAPSTANWSDSANWESAVAPAASGTLQFGASSTTVLNNDLSSPTVFGALGFTSTASAYTISGNAITLGTSSVATIISNSSANTQTINNNITLGNAAQTVALTAGGGNVTLGGVISGAGSSSGLVASGAGILTLTGVNTYGGVTTIAANATVRTNNASGLGSNTSGSAVSIAGGGTLDLRSDSSTTFGPGAGYNLYGTSSGTITLNVNQDTAAGSNQTLTVGNINFNTASVLNVTGGNGYALSTGTVTADSGKKLINNAPGGVTLGALVWTAYAGGSTFTVDGTGTTTVTGNVTRGNLAQPGQSLVKNGSGTLTFNGAYNTFGGSITLNQGTLTINGSLMDMAVNGGNLIVSNTNTGVATAAVFNLNSSYAVYGLSGSSARASSGTNTNTINLGAGVTLTSRQWNQNANFFGSITGAGGLTVAPLATTLTTIANGVATTGTLTLAGANTYSGDTTINGGALALDFNQNTAITGVVTGSNIINNTANNSALALGGGSLFVIGRGATVNSQQFNGLKVNAGASNITLNGNGATSLALSLGNVTRSAGGTVSFVNPTGTISAANGITTTAANTNGILGGYATVGNDWATVNGSGNIVALTTAGYTNDTWTDGANTTVTASGAVVDGAVTNTLRFNTAAASTLTLGGNATLTSGGILVSSTVGANATTISGGTLRGASGQDLIVIQNNTNGSLTIDSVIADNTSATALTKSGSGTLTLTGVNTYTGATYLNGGTVQISAVTGLGDALAATNSIVFNGGTLESTAGNYDLSRSIALAGTGTLQVDAGSTVTVGGANVISGAGIFNKSGAGTLVLAGANTYTGLTIVSGGILNIQNNLALGDKGVGTAGNVMANIGTQVQSGATLQLQGGITVGTSGTATAEYLVLNGSGAAGQTGALVSLSGTNTVHSRISLTGSTTISVNSGLLTMNGDIQVASGTASTLTLAGSGSGTWTGNSLSSLASGTATSLIKDGSGTWTITGDMNNYTGVTLIKSGTLAINTINRANADTNSSLGALNATTRAADHLVFAGDSTLKIINGGSASMTRSFTVNDGVSATFDIVTGGTLGISGSTAVTTGNLVKSGSGVMIITGTMGYTGTTTIASGTLQLGTNLALQNSTMNTSGTGVLVLNSAVNAPVFGGLSGTGNLVLSSTVTSLTLNAANNAKYSGNLSGGTALSVTKKGSGTQTFAGINSYTGATAVNAGNLVVSGSLTATASVSGSSGTLLSVESGLINNLATITTAGTLQGKGSVGAVNISTGGSLNPGQTTETTQTLGTLTANGNVTFADSTTMFTIRIGQAGNDKLAINGGSLTLNQVSLVLDVTAYTGTVGEKFTIVSGGAGLTGLAYNNVFSQGTSITAGNGLQFGISYAAGATGNDIVLEVLTVPEPTTWGMLVTGVGMLFGLNRMRRNRAAR